MPRPRVAEGAQGVRQVKWGFVEQHGLAAVVDREEVLPARTSQPHRREIAFAETDASAVQ